MRAKAPPFSAEARQVDGKAVLDLHGEINGLADEAINAAYAEASRANPETILLNFSDVDYINSTGIALIVGLLAQARQAHIPLHTYGLSDHYVEVFRITRLSDFMTIHTDEAELLGQV